MKISGITYVPRKTHRVKKTFIYLFLLALVAFVAIMAVSAYAGWNLTHPPKASIPAFAANTVPQYKDIEFTDKTKKITLKGWYFESKGSDKTIIMSHGYKGYRLPLKEKTFDIIKSLNSRGYNVLTFDFRNSGNSGGSVSSIGYYEKYDLLGAIDYAKSIGSKHITLLGYSMGASTSILAAAEVPSDVDAVIADSPFTDLEEYLNQNMPVWSGLPSIPFNSSIQFSVNVMFGLNSSKVSPKDVIDKFAPKPVLFIHGDSDLSIPYSNSQELYDIYQKKAGYNAELWITSGTDHIQSYEKHPEEYMNNIFQFLGTKVYTK